MTNIMYKSKILLIIFLSIFIINAKNFITNLENILNKFQWKNRIILLISGNANDVIVDEVKTFFNKQKCENEERNLKLVKIIGSKINKIILPTIYKNKFGIWLIGYDGKIKAYSRNSSLLYKTHEIIDSMPIRKIEMNSFNSKCK